MRVKLQRVAVAIELRAVRAASRSHIEPVPQIPSVPMIFPAERTLAPDGRSQVLRALV